MEIKNTTQLDNDEFGSISLTNLHIFTLKCRRNFLVALTLHIRTINYLLNIIRSNDK